MSDIWDGLGNISSILTIIGFILGAGAVGTIITKKNKKKIVIKNNGINLGVMSGENEGIIENEVETGDLNAGKK